MRNSGHRSWLTGRGVWHLAACWESGGEKQPQNRLTTDRRGKQDRAGGLETGEGFYKRWWSFVIMSQTWRGLTCSISRWWSCLHNPSTHCTRSVAILFQCFISLITCSCMNEETFRGTVNQYKYDFFFLQNTKKISAFLVTPLSPNCLINNVVMLLVSSQFVFSLTSSLFKTQHTVKVGSLKCYLEYFDVGLCGKVVSNQYLTCCRYLFRGQLFEEMYGNFWSDLLSDSYLYLLTSQPWHQSQSTECEERGKSLHPVKANG